MCTRYFMDDAPKELSEIIIKAKQSKLADTFVQKLARPVITKGEVRPTDVVPVNNAALFVNITSAEIFDFINYISAVVCKAGSVI